MGFVSGMMEHVLLALILFFVMSPSARFSIAMGVGVFLIILMFGCNGSLRCV